MRSFSCFCLCLAAGLVLLQAQTAPAQTTDLYEIHLDQYGDGTYVEYSPPVVTGSNVISSGTLASSGGIGSGLELHAALPH